jgi:hypothetical protein
MAGSTRPLTDVRCPAVNVGTGLHGRSFTATAPANPPAPIVLLIRRTYGVGSRSLDRSFLPKVRQISQNRQHSDALRAGVFLGSGGPPVRKPGPSEGDPADKTPPRESVRRATGLLLARDLVGIRVGDRIGRADHLRLVDLARLKLRCPTAHTTSPGGRGGTQQAQVGGTAHKRRRRMHIAVVSCRLLLTRLSWSSSRSLPPGKRVHGAPRSAGRRKWIVQRVDGPSDD